MASGLLEVRGTIDLAQFWPTGGADADTTSMRVDVGAADAFRFRPHPGAPFQPTHAFVDATVAGRVRKLAVDAKGRITVRLQGIDAPELHYTPASELPKAQRSAEQSQLYLEWNLKYRQRLAETATVELAKFLASAGASPLPCRVVTAVDEPGEVFDTYARFVGNIVVSIGGGEVDVNRWLCRQGWVLPAFYSSMSREEIEGFLADADAAWQADRGIWPHLADFVGRLDHALVYRGPKNGQAPVPDAAADRGDVVPPKLFRRLAAWEVNKRAKMVTGSFAAYLGGKNEQCYKTIEFLDQGPSASTVHAMADFVDADGWISVWPEELVFQEAPSDVRGPGGAPVAW